MLAARFLVLNVTAGLDDENQQALDIRQQLARQLPVDLDLGHNDAVRFAALIDAVRLPRNSFRWCWQRRRSA
jgi:hypothetical protein